MGTSLSCLPSVSTTPLPKFLTPCECARAAQSEMLIQRHAVRRGSLAHCRVLCDPQTDPYVNTDPEQLIFGAMIYCCVAPEHLIFGAMIYCCVAGSRKEGMLIVYTTVD